MVCCCFTISRRLHVPVWMHVCASVSCLCICLCSCACAQLWPLALCTLHSALCTLHSALCTLRSALCTLHSVLCTLQVEHGITEMVNRLDLVAWQLKLQCPGLQVGKPSIILVTIIVVAVVQNPRLCGAGLSWLHSLADFYCLTVPFCLAFYSACIGCSTCVRPCAHHTWHLSHDHHNLCVMACRHGCNSCVSVACLMLLKVCRLEINAHLPFMTQKKKLR